MIEQKLYTEIIRTFPINAVELLVLNQQNEILMLKRENEPAKSQWWIPGGRILFAESRMNAAKRLLKNECGMTASAITDFGMYDYQVKNKEANHHHHIISTIYVMKISHGEVKIDSQSNEFKWAQVSEWLKKVEHGFLKHLLLNLSQKKTDPSFWDEQANDKDKIQFIRDDLYNVILQSLSIPCVDLLVRNKKGEILLVKRKNEPEKDKWWVPGGRVHFGEKRTDTAIRKLKEECNLEGTHYTEIGNFEFVYNLKNDRVIHNISSLYSVTVNSENVTLDEQSSDFSWRSSDAWLRESLSEFITDIIKNKITYGKTYGQYN
ncbi:MAG: NUDIX hydrolase [Bacteroidetes bacterium]|nr:NUDIX hydrolase [Bacteroidota bacterium]